ncbi:MAG: CmcI family methyltransferase [Chloroherpetonaceae bacterium]|nr:cephalosporin hydroxylase family protein [Chthonomonadaceae bacterium]MDW8208274.1 CmcI family methyltransferase [Chloroherpetonaceae bacterium]
MRITIDTQERTVTVEQEGRARQVGLYTREAFEILTHHWLRVGWDLKYPYTFSWFGRPIIQLPEDMIRVQEVIYRVRPDVILETGVAHGGSLIYYATLCKAMEKGRVIGVDIEIRPHNRAAIEAHEMAPFIQLIEGNSVDPDVVRQVESLIHPGEAVLVLLDSCHTREHVLSELNAYHHLVSPGSYIVATDGIMRDLHDVPRGRPEWAQDNPATAAAEFAAQHPEFVLEQPPWPFNESVLTRNVTFWPGAWLRRKQDG